MPAGANDPAVRAPGFDDALDQDPAPAKAQNLSRDQAEVNADCGAGEPLPVANLHGQSKCSQRRDAAQALQDNGTGMDNQADAYTLEHSWNLQTSDVVLPVRQVWQETHTLL